MVTIRIDRLLCNSVMNEHRCLEKIKRLLKIAGKYNNQQHYKAILEAEMASTPEGFTDNSPI